MKSAIAAHLPDEHFVIRTDGRVKSHHRRFLDALREGLQLRDQFPLRSGCDFAAWIGIVPRQELTGGNQKLGPISKRGDQYLRRILVVGAHAVLKRARHQPEKYPWVTRLLERKPFRVVAVAVANKMARVAWALLARGGSYRAPALAAAA